MSYQGSCHCGAVKFTVQGSIQKVLRCNCSICTKKGALHYRVPADQFTLLEGEDALQLYQFGTKTAKHYFCKHCGVHPFARPRTAPDMYAVNIKCLDNYDWQTENFEYIDFDGQNWEEAFTKLNKS